MAGIQNATLGRNISQLGFMPREVNFEQFKYGKHVQERLDKLSI